MAEWNQNFRIFSPDQEDTCTFDMSQEINTKNNNFEDKHGLCVRCKTMAKMSPNKVLNEFHGVCLTENCPGYMGHAPTERIFKLTEDEHVNDDSSDDTPLLFDKSPTNHGSTTSSGEELDTLEHCHVTMPKREKLTSRYK